ncbi:MAG: sigma-E processing peptidase SpoIIGA [Erysipelotrichales bacterium]|nr:sigma-E processing peptidase SpoIIGA [Erysipelotrichales bacterium]
MKVYIDLIIVINFFYDFLIISSTSTLLKRNINLKKVFVSSLVGELSLLTLFISFDKTLLIIFKVLLSVLMVYISFGRKKFLENIFYFYIITIVLGGSCYLLGGDNYLINIIMLMIFSPIIITLYIKSLREYKERINTHHDVIIIDGENTYKFNGYLDTGNKLIDPITKLPVIMVSKDLPIISKRYFYVPYTVVNSSSVLKCIKVDKVLIDNRLVSVLLGLCDNNIFSDGADVILNDSLREMI